MRDGDGNELGIWAQEAPTLNQADSELIGFHLANLVHIMQNIDWPYFEQAMLAMEEKATRYDSTAVLNRLWTQEHGHVLRAEAKAMRTLWEYRASLMAVDLAAIPSGIIVDKTFTIIYDSETMALVAQIDNDILNIQDGYKRKYPHLFTL